MAPDDRFDPRRYLDANPDVDEAVRGDARGAWRHYVNFGFREGRSGVSEAARRAASSVLGPEVTSVAPPDRLISRVHGSADSATFDQVGRIIALDVYSALESRLRADSAPAILDFGCGCARVTRYLRRIYATASITGTDIDREAIDWCTRNCAGIRFTVNADTPPMAFPNRSFDLVCAISVFTHLPEDLQLLWLEELRRVTRKDGFLVLTFAGDHLVRPVLESDKAAELDRAGFYHFAYRKTEGLPDYYQATWHTLDYVRRVWSRYFRIAEVIAGGINGHQDLVLCQPIG
jgi:SAM-dependent methyltransferase